MTAPRWIRIYLTVVTAMAAAFSALAYVSPGIQFGTWPAFGAAGALSLAGPVGLYIARNVATVLVGAFALTSGAHAAIVSAFVLRGATDAMDAVHNLIGGNVPAAGFAGVMFAVEAFAVSQLRKSSAD